MTAQVNDVVEHADADWNLAGVSGGRLFDPRDHGINPRPASSACWCGFHCRYALRQGTLTLELLNIALEGQPPHLFDRAAEPPTLSYGFTASYRLLGKPLDFTGGLLLARGFRQELYVHMGYHPAWKYSHVVEVQLQAGHITDVRDCSQAMAQIRARLARKDAPGASSSSEEITSWIERAFSRKY